MNPFQLPKRSHYRLKRGMSGAQGTTAKVGISSLSRVMTLLAFESPGPRFAGGSGACAPSTPSGTSHPCRNPNPAERVPVLIRDVSWWIAVLFTVSSVTYILCGLFYWLPLAEPWTAFPHESDVGGGVTDFVSSTLFLAAGVLLIVEATNEDQTGCFGWAVEQAVNDGYEEIKFQADKWTRINRFWRTPAAGYLPQPSQCRHRHNGSQSNEAARTPRPNRKWQWVPTWSELKTHYFCEIGFLAAFNLCLGAIVFWISSVLGLPGIYDKLSTHVLWGTYWLTYLIGSVLFVISSTLYVLETQKKWYAPAIHKLGWWIAVWNLIGSVGWVVSAGFGYCPGHWCEKQSYLSIIWASVAYLIGSLLLWYEAMDKFPVQKDRTRLQ